MAKISNTSAYPQIVNPDINDYLIITDKENQLKTKSATIGSLQGLFGTDTVVSKVLINNATLLTLNTTPAVLVSAQGAGKVIDVISVMFSLEPGSQKFDYGTGALPISIGSEQIGVITNSNTTINSDVDVVFKPEMPNSNTEVIPTNTALTLGAQANPTQGTGVLYANVFYRVLTVGKDF